jgi:hypothetical protein
MKRVSCSCGYVASAETADELLAAVETHIAARHAVDRAPAYRSVETLENGRPARSKTNPKEA